MTPYESIQLLKKRMNASIIGQEKIVERLIIGLLANGNLLVEGLPGLAKTRAVRAISTKSDVPKAFLSHHNTAEGTVTYFGFADSETTALETTIVIAAGQFATSPPQYWHRVELTDDAQFNINFWSAEDKKGKRLISTKKPLTAGYEKSKAMAKDEAL